MSFCYTLAVINRTRERKTEEFLECALSFKNLTCCSPERDRDADHPEQRVLGGLGLGGYKALLTFGVAEVCVGRNAFSSTIHE